MTGRLCLLPQPSADPSESVAEDESPLASTFRREAAEGPLLIADISGYTSFLRAVAEAHRDDLFADGAVPVAYELMSSLLDAIVARIVPPFTLAKLEGDAVFVFASGPGAPRGPEIVERIRHCYEEFRGLVAQAGRVWICDCAACSLATGLDLKFVLHAGRYVVHQIAGQRELSGPEVVMTHRLLKNGAARVLGHGAYALVTAAAVHQLAVPVVGAVPVTETYEHYPPIDAFAFALR